jgi:acetylglutamate kinase
MSRPDGGLDASVHASSVPGIAPAAPSAGGGPGPARITVLKLGGELLETAERLAGVVSAVGGLAARGPLVVVHGGGREIDAEIARRGLPRRSVDGLRVTDAATLEAVVAVLAGSVNTRLVAALVASGIPAVGLTGADGRTVPVVKAPPHRATDRRLVDLDLVGEPVDAGRPRLLDDLLRSGYVPVLACLGMGVDGALLNVNADTLAAHLAGALGASRLVVAGATAGVLDGAGVPAAELTPDAIDALVADGTVSAGMVAKLAACRAALQRGVEDVVIADGRDPSRLLAGAGTRIVRTAHPTTRTGAP